ncbi:MAG: helicase-related protein [Rhodobacterales bacterium]
MPLRSRICAVLGPTNTGKTHYAIERMLAYRSGVIGLPLRLLAREVYDRIVAKRGPSAVALLTGEERIVPPRAAYWVCTVEAMPLGLGAEFVAIDEIQLCADPERGHVFTNRLLHLRGLSETLFLGSDAMWGVIAKLVPDADFMRRERFSNLSYSGSKKISRMPARSAIVGFSVDNVYSIAELLRRQKGGAAVVMGALSPRARNAQVEMYQNGDVDYLVATDAIGMGLNLDIDHVAFSGTSKFDGHKMRRLMPNELAQIAGRAGRYLSPGTFGVTGEARPLEDDVVDAIEAHRFTPIKKLQWRNARLEFGSIATLLRSLETPSDDPLLMKAREAQDHLTLRSLSDLPEIKDRVCNPRDVKLLWEACQLPDFRQVSHAEHVSIVGAIFEHLAGAGEIPTAWFAERVQRIDKTTGDIDALSKRLAYIRTWTYVTQRKGWLRDENYWRDETRAVEDRLSDALHSALTKRFVDRRTSILMRRLKQKEALVAEVNKDGEVTIEGEFVGKLDAFQFQLDKTADADQAKTLKAAAYQALQPEFSLRSDRFYNAPDTEFDFTEQGGLMWGEHAIGKLVKGDDIMSPKIKVFVDDEAGEVVADKVRKRLGHFIDRKITAAFEHLIAMKNDETLPGLAKGVAFRLAESLGVIPRSAIAQDIKALDQEQRGTLRKHGIRFGQYTIFHHLMLKPAPTRLRLVLWSLFEELDEFPEAPPAGLVTVPAVVDAPKGYYPRAGYRLAGERAIRIDMLERLADMIRAFDVKAGFEANPDMLSITGMTLEQFADLMQGLGYAAEKGERDKVKHVAAVKSEVETKPEATPPGAEAAPAPEAEAAPEAVEDEDTKEVFYTFKWVPKARPATRPQAHQGKPHKPKAKSKGPQRHSAPPPRKEKPIDPDNPFAALMALKNKI